MEPEAVFPKLHRLLNVGVLAEIGELDRRRTRIEIVRKGLARPAERVSRLQDSLTVPAPGEVGPVGPFEVARLLNQLSGSVVLFEARGDVGAVHIQHEIGGRSPAPTQSADGEVVEALADFSWRRSWRKVRVINAEAATGDKETKGLRGREIVSELEVAIVKTILGKARTSYEVH